MLDTSPNNLLMEVQASEELRNKHLEVYDEQVRRYHGPHWRSGSAEQDYYPENHYHEYISLVVPRIVLDNPRVRVTTRRPGSQALVAEAIRHGLNRWSRDTKLSRLLIRLAVDMMFNFGIALITQEPQQFMRPYGDPKRWPMAYRVSQRLFFCDYLARHDSEARYKGHQIKRDKEDLLKEARKNRRLGWNIEAIESMATDSQDERMEKAEQAGGINANPRGEIRYYEVWVPEVQQEGYGTDKGYHGSIFTIGKASTLGSRVNGEYTAKGDQFPHGVYLRKPRPFYGPREGPYVSFGVYTVPDSSTPLAPLTAVQAQIDDLNEHAIAGAHADAMYKRVVFVDETDKRLMQRVKDSKDFFVVPVQGLKEGQRQVVQAEFGGSSRQQWEMIAQKRERLDRNSGIFDAQRGMVAGRGTATEVAVADESSSARMNFIEHQFQDAVARLLSGVAWYMYHDDRVDFPLGPEASESLGMVEPWFRGGNEKSGSGATFDDLELEIEPYSMTRTTEGLQQRRTMEMTQLVMSMAPMIPQMPWVKWREVLKKLGDALNFPELQDVINMEVAQAFTGVPQPDQPQPRLGRDAGKIGAYGQRSPAPSGAGSEGRSRGQQAMQRAF